MADWPGNTQAFNEAFGRVVRQRRNAKGLSQERFSFEAGYDRTYISGVERGVRNPTLVTICRLAAALDTQPSSLLRSTEALVKRGKAD